MSVTSVSACAEPPQVLQPSWILWGCAFALSVMGTTLLYSASPGVNWFIMILAFSLSFLAFSCSNGRPLQRETVVPLAIACFLGCGVALTADGVLEGVIAIAALYAIATAVVSASPPTPSPSPSIFASPRAAIAVTRETAAHISLASDALRQARADAKLRGIALAVPITLLLALLLSEADPTFDAARQFVFNELQTLSIVPRSVFFCVLGICVLGALGSALRGGDHSAPALEDGPRPNVHFGDVERLIVTGSIAVLFTVFFTLQVSYLFGNPGGRSGSGVSYAEAVHRGFTELNIASSVCAAVLFALRHYAGATKRPKLIQALEWIVVIQAQILLASAFYRVNLYEAAYGFTRLRLYVQAYAAVASIGLVCLLLELRAQLSIDRLLRRVLTAAAVTFGILVLVNSDAWIARQNLLRYQRTGQLDVPYLTWDLGPDAVPSIVTALPALPIPLAAQTADCLRERYAALDNHQPSHWFEWSARRAALHRSLAQMDLNVPAIPAATCAGTRP